MNKFNFVGFLAKGEEVFDQNSWKMEAEEWITDSYFMTSWYSLFAWLSDSDSTASISSGEMRDGRS